jgi:hypothetical protein
MRVLLIEDNQDAIAMMRELVLEKTDLAIERTV